MEQITSYADYKRAIRRLIRSLTTADQLRFCVWCIQRFPIEFGDEVWDGLTDSENLRLHEIISELANVARPGKLAELRSKDLQQEIEQFGPEDEVAAIEVNPDATEFQSMVWQTLEFCRTHNPDHACAVSEALINSWDYRVEDRAAGYKLENMFTFSELRREYETQATWIETVVTGAPSNST